MRTQKEALEYILEKMESHPMFCPAACAEVMRGDYSALESDGDDAMALTSEISAVCRLSLNLEIPN